MCNESEMRRRGFSKIDMTPVDEILVRVKRLNEVQMVALETRLFGEPRVAAAQFVAWEFDNRKALLDALPSNFRSQTGNFWKAIEKVCKFNDRARWRIPKCCLNGERIAERELRRRMP